MPISEPFTSDSQVAAIAGGLIDRTLPRSSWTHAAHFSATLWLLSTRPYAQVATELPGLIRAYNVATGLANTDAKGYHETITQASLRAAAAFLADRPERPLFETCNALMRSPLGQPDWLLTHWSRERLFSTEARREYVAPDLAPLPFA